MNSLAETYFTLGRHADALAMFERALEFFRRVLPENHPDTGEEPVLSVAFTLLIVCFMFDVLQSWQRVILLGHTCILEGTLKHL